MYLRCIDLKLGMEVRWDVSWDKWDEMRFCEIEPDHSSHLYGTNLMRYLTRSHEISWDGNPPQIWRNFSKYRRKSGQILAIFAEMSQNDQNSSNSIHLIVGPHIIGEISLCIVGILHKSRQNVRKIDRKWGGQLSHEPSHYLMRFHGTRLSRTICPIYRPKSHEISHEPSRLVSLPSLIFEYLSNSNYEP